MKYTKIIAFALVISFLLCSCTAKSSSSIDEPEEAIGKSSENFCLAYCANDVFNPYSAVTKVNQELTLLLFDPLIKLNSNFEIIYVLAESAEVSGNKITVKLKDMNFSDGTAVSANDVVYSMSLAKGALNYQNNLAEIASFYAADNKTVVFTLTKDDPLAVNLLDFPIIKSGSEKNANANNLSLPPTGTGRYTIDVNKAVLTANEAYFMGKLKIKSIQLVNVPDDEALQHSLKVGGISAFYSDLDDCELYNMVGNAVNVNLNNLVYIGVNFKNGLLANENMRYAVSASLDREAIATSAFYGFATAATGPFNDNYTGIGNMQTINTSTDKQLAVAYLGKIGYNNKNGNGIFVDSKGKALEISLLVNSDNKFKVMAANQVKSQLEAVGIAVKIEAIPYDQYMSKLQAGSFQLYIGEVKIKNNMDISALVTPNSGAAFGLIANTTTDDKSSDDENKNKASSDSASNTSSNDTSSAVSDNPDADDTLGEETQVGGITLTTVDAVNGYYNGTYTLADVISAFNSELPVIPICHRSGILICNSDLKVKTLPSVDDIYFGISDYTFK